MLPIINIFGFTIESSILMRCIGILFSSLFYIFYGHRKGLNILTGIVLSIIILIIEIIGAKLLYIIENFNSLGENKITFAGFSLLGVFFSLPIILTIVSKIFKLHYLKLLDFVIIGVFIELGFYRIGCMMEGCCGGFTFPYGIIGNDGLRYFPTQVIESVFDFLLAFILFKYFKSPNFIDGEKFFYGVIIYSLIRFILEFTRIRVNIIFNFSSSHILCLVLIIIYLVVILINRKKSINYYYGSLKY